jgi:glycosyltransferase involved in cell wall biosynthesis
LQPKSLPKSTVFDLMMTHRALRTVHVLDPRFITFYRQRGPGTGKLRYLPDPYAPAACTGGVPAHPLIEALHRQGRSVLLLYGGLDTRKGAPQLLRAIRMLSASDRRRIALVLAGRVPSQCARALRRELDSVLNTEDPDCLLVELMDRYLPADELEQLIAGADVVLAPYQRHVGSSGVIIQSAARRKVVIGQAYGLSGRLIRKYQLGYGVETARPEAIASAIVAATRQPWTHDDRKLALLLRNRNPTNFAKRLLA